MNDSIELKILFRILRRFYPKGMFYVRRLLNEKKREKDLRESYERDIMEQRDYIIQLQKELYGIQKRY